jgi:hypothetical protein
MENNQSQRILKNLAVVAKQAAITAKDPLLDKEAKLQASLDKQVALTNLVGELMQQINKQPKPQTDSSRYVYEEALQETCLYICKNIDKYDPERGTVMGWVVFLLKMRKINAFHWVNWDVKSIYAYTAKEESEVNLYDIYVSPVVNSLPSEKLLEFIKEDPEGLLQRTLFNHNPNASFQAILLKKCEDKSWKEIVQELNLGATHGPIYTFYQRCCDKFASYFTKYLCE